MMMCTKCHKNVAVVFITKMENGKTINEGLCLACAREMGLPSIDKIAPGLNIDDEDMKNITGQLAGMFGEGLGGASGMEEMLGFSAAPEEDNYEDLGEISNLEEPSHTVKTKDKKKKKKKLLDTFGINLTAKAAAGMVDRVIGREREIERMIEILNRRTKNNPCLLGEPGVGKTAIAEGLAVRIVEKSVPAKLQNKEIYVLDFTAIVAGTQFRGQFEARLKGILEEAKKQGNVILVIDEIHNIMGAGDAEGAMNAANILKPALSKGDIQLIGATTLGEYRKHIEKDSALERRLQTIIVDEPGIEDTVEILKGIRGYYEDYHHVIISDEVIRAAAVLSERYITERFLPDKAIDVIDEAGSKANLHNETLSQLTLLKDKLKEVLDEKDDAVSEDSTENYQRAAELKMKECQLREEISILEASCEATPITVDQVACVIENMTKIPVQKINQLETDKLLSLEEILHKRVIGQDAAVNAVSRAIRRNRAGLSKKLRPASFIFLGPTGVGKTELAKALAEAMFDSEDFIIRMDMSEYMEKHSVAKIIGSPPGYVGYDDAGQLTEKVRRRPYSVILLDEIEKAHPDIHNILLQILDDGRLTDSHGKVVSFENTIIIMTSNAGSDWKSQGFGFTPDASRANYDKVNTALKSIFKPEFINRVDEIVTFNRLTEEDTLKILDIMLSELEYMLKEKGITLNVTDEVKQYLAKNGFDDKNGARPMRRLIRVTLEDKISEAIIRGQLTSGSVCNIGLVNGEIALL
ncbi:MAG: ATP-dependent Clp protease ATP-binding subunit [Bacillota bacterium]|nr:ATP-dependent Clp protease ATP-binding subunit [Bacillota bacterium]